MPLVHKKYISCPRFLPISAPACRKNLTDLSLTKLSGNSVCKIWLRSSCFALGPTPILQTSFPDNFVGPVSFKYKFEIIHTKIARLRRASIIVSIFAAKRRFVPSFWTWSQPPRNLVPDALRAYPLHKPTDWIRPCSYGFLVSSQYSIFVVIILFLPNFKVKA